MGDRRLGGELDEVPSGGCGEARASGPGKILEGCQGPGCLQRADETVMAVAIILILIIMHAKLGRGGPDSPGRSEEKELRWAAQMRAVHSSGRRLG